MNRKALSRILFLWIFLASWGQVGAQLLNEPDPDRVPDPEPWREPGFDAPKYPQDQDLIAVRVEPTATLKMYLDRSSIEVKNRMTRLAYVLESSSGARNVLVEGFRCSGSLYTTYATGGGDGKLYSAKKRGWSPVDKLATRNNYRLTLLNDYLCDFNRAPRTPRDVVRLVRSPQYFPDPEQQ